MVDLRLDQLSMSLDAQIQNLKDDGVKFEICDEGEAKKYLLSHNYLFRMKRYAVNFDCDEQDKYKNLDFALLKDLAIIDYEFRLMLEYITSNAEHALKLRFNTLLMQDPVCDGYKVSQLVDPDGEFLFDLQKGYQKRSKVHFSPYSDDLVKKYFPNPEIWNLWELFSLSDLESAYESYLKSLSKRDSATKLFGNLRRLRNAVSHSSPLLLGIDRSGWIPKTEFLDSCLKDLFGEDSVPPPVPSMVKKSQLIYDYASLLCMFLIVCNSPSIRKNAAEKVLAISQRIMRDYERLYTNNATCIILRTTLVSIVTLSRRFSAYIDEEEHQAHEGGTLHFLP